MTSCGRCSVCGCARGNILHRASEMMLGRGDTFVYVECGDCGALSLQDRPPSLSAYYPPDYYSFDRHEQLPPLLPAAARVVAAAVLREGLVGKGFARFGLALARAPAVPVWVALLAGQGVTTDAAVLDVGCGSGHRLRALRRFGFRNLTGADPYLPAGTQPGEGIAFIARPVEEIPGRYDLVMFHHSLEHVGDAVSALRAARDRLSHNGLVVVRVPLADSFAWRRYRVHWVQLDAPRHVVVPTVRAMHALAARTGFTVIARAHDSDAFQFWGSEQYRRGIALTDPRSHLVDPSRSSFPAAVLSEYSRRARRLNAIGDGDQAAFLLQPAA